VFHEFFNEKYLLKPVNKKLRCISCGITNVKFNKEHLFPVWLIKKTKTNKTSIRWSNKKISTMKATLPICIECNKEFSKNLEKPVSKIFDDLEFSRGISDNEAELLVRWMWKTQGLAWCFNNSYDNYTHTYTLKERSLLPINNIRGYILLAISIINKIDSSFQDSPLGFDSTNELDCVFSAGVFSKIAIIVSLVNFEKYIPNNYSKYILFQNRQKCGDMKLFFPKVGFRICTEAVFFTKKISIILSKEHDNLVRELQKNHESNISKIIKDYNIKIKSYN